VEADHALTIPVSGDSELHNEAAEFLVAIRSNCERFDPNAVPYYKWLQGMDTEEEIWVLELRGSPSALGANGKLTVFGRSEEDYRNLKSVDKNIVVSLLDEVAGGEFLYEAAITDTGRLSGAGVTFASRLYARQDGSPRPQLKGPEVLARSGTDRGDRVNWHRAGTSGGASQEPGSVANSAPKSVVTPMSCFPRGGPAATPIAGPGA